MSIPLRVDLEHALVKPKISSAFLKRLTSLPAPDFQTHQSDTHELEAILKPYQKYKNVIVIGNGGSRTSSLALIGALTKYPNKKAVLYCSTMDPSYIDLLKRCAKPKDTLVMPISKSGTNVDVLEPLSAFWDRYPILPVTGERGSILFCIARKNGWETIVHPEVDGRFSGRTSSAYAPAIFTGVEVAEVDRGARAAYEYYAYHASVSRNDALQAALVCFELEKKKYTEIFVPIYSWEYFHFLPLMIQLVHESTGKGGYGQTIYGDLGPESQHHTNQRFFGGRKNVMGMFVVNEAMFARTVPTIKIPDVLMNLPLRDGSLGDLNGVPLGKGLQFDFEGTREEAVAKKIPHLTLSIQDATGYSVGWFMSFLHFFAVYSALVRGQNPFDQPEVEQAKTRSFTKLKLYRV